MDTDCSVDVGVGVGAALAVGVAVTVAVSVGQTIQGLPAVLMNSHNINTPQVMAAIIPR
jgi:hypothetical protein